MNVSIFFFSEKNSETGDLLRNNLSNLHCKIHHKPQQISKPLAINQRNSARSKQDSVFIAESFMKL